MCPGLCRFLVRGDQHPLPRGEAICLDDIRTGDGIEVGVGGLDVCKGLAGRRRHTCALHDAFGVGLGGLETGEGFTRRADRGLGQTSSQTDLGPTRPPTANHNPYQRDPLELDRFLQRGPTQTGGRRRDLQVSMSAERAVNDPTAQLQNEYVVVYSRPGMLIPPERIQVAANRDGLDVRGTPVIIDSEQ